MDVRRFKELCQRLDELAAILEIMECDPINADLHREASNALSQALSEIERLRSNADQHRERGSKGRLSIRRLRRVERRLYSSCPRISSRRQLRPGHWPLTELYLLAGCVCRLSAITREPCRSVKQLPGHRLQAAS